MSTYQDETQNHRQAPVSRRSLLQAGAAGLATVALFRDGSFARTVEAKPGNGGNAVRAPLAVGFNNAINGDTFVIDPASMVAGDAELGSRGAKIRVLGIQPARDHSVLSQIDSMSIDIVYPAGPNAAFMAWSYRSQPVPQVSAPLTISVPVDASGLQMIVSYRQAGADDEVQSTVHLVTDAQDRQPKLVTGTYLIAIPDDNHQLPDWSRHELKTLHGEDGSEQLCLCEMGGTDHAPVRCPHVVVSVA